MALSIPSTVGSKVKSVTAPSSGASVATKPNVSRYDTRGSPVNSASSLLAGAAAAALNPGNRHATRRAALIGGPTAPVVKSSMQYPVVSPFRVVNLRVFTARNRFCGKVMLSQASVSHSVHVGGGVGISGPRSVPGGKYARRAGIPTPSHQY